MDYLRITYVEQEKWEEAEKGSEEDGLDEQNDSKEHDECEEAEIPSDSRNERYFGDADAMIVIIIVPTTEIQEDGEVEQIDMKSRTQVEVVELA